MSKLTDEEHELIEGELYYAGSQYYHHAMVRDRLSTKLDEYLSREKKGEAVCYVYTKFDEKNILAPDIAVYCSKIKVIDDFIDGIIGSAPDLVIEIVSTATARRDLTIKKDVYERFGVREYWVVSSRDENIMVFRLKDGRYVLDDIYANASSFELESMTEQERQGFPMSIQVGIFDDLVISLREIFGEED